MKTKMKQVLALLLAIVLFGSSLASCAFMSGDELEQMDPTGPEFITGEETEDGIPRDGRLSISFVPDDPLNPYTSTSRDNLAVAGLIYEGLFALDAAFTAVPVLAENISTLDGSRFTIEIKSGITFHNGAPLTVTDVIYSMNRARGSALYQSRLEMITGYSRIQNEAGEASPYVFELTINRVHGNLPVLLTFPVIQSGTGHDTVPPGTGPFFHPYTGEGTPRLAYFPAHPRSAELPIHTIYLAEISTVEQLAAHFNSGLLDIIALDPTTTGEPRLAGTRELRQIEASMIDFIGFNVHRPETGRSEVRQAISRAIDRAYITESIMHGNAVSSTLPIHPILPFYDELLALQHEFDLEFARELLAAANAPVGDAAPGVPAEGADDADDAEEIEVPETPRVRLTLLVAAGSTLRLEVATFIAANISALGYQVEILDLPHAQFMYALQAGNFDLFYGQVRLQPDFDLSPILHGDLAFGGIETLIAPRVIDDFLASSPSNRGEMANAMGAAIFAEAPITTIGFRNLAVATQRGVVAGLSPTQENVYHNVWDWLLDL